MSRSKKTWLLAAVLPILAGLALLVAIRIVASIDYLNNDFFTFWLAGHMVPLGGNPYTPAQWVGWHHQLGVTWIPNQAYVYPLPLSLLFIPLGWLPLKQAYIAWVALSELMILGALVLAVRAGGGTRFGRLFLPLLVGTVFFRPTVLTLFNGQISGWLLLLLAGTVALWEKGNWEWGSLLLPLLMLKPNIGGPVLLLTGVWLLWQKKYTSILAIAGGALALLFIGIIQDPHWVSEYWSIGNLKMAQNFGTSPTVWGVGYLVCRHNATCTPIVGGVLGAALLAGLLWISIRCKGKFSPLRLIALVSTMTLLVTPYTWTYDQVLLILPIVDITLALDENGKHFAAAAGLFVGLDVLIVLLLVADTLLNVEIFNVAIPLIIFGIYFFRRAQPAEQPVFSTGT